ncbi:MAG TPA: hypothetical protein VJ739_00820 [Gemmataceae bacterium]|nr:hypothetical protein [Gemmataceae bacterium]
MCWFSIRYPPLLPLLASLPVGTLFLEFCTPRAGDLAVLRDRPRSQRVGVGVVNPKTDAAEPVREIVDPAEQAIALLGSERVLLNPECGFATFADTRSPLPAWLSANWPPSPSRPASSAPGTGWPAIGMSRPRAVSLPARFMARGIAPPRPRVTHPVPAPPRPSADA